jgi:4-alpha-glucanotransferase
MNCSEIPKFVSQTPAAPHWEKIGVRSHHGVGLALFSLRTENGSGIGEFSDLIPFIKWLKSLKFDVLQLLPINDTGSHRYPYGALSVFALNPIYLKMKDLPMIRLLPESSEQLAELRALNAADRLDYSAVLAIKMSLLNSCYQAYGEEICQERPYTVFKQNNPWVKEYALFKVFKQISHDANSLEWKPEWQYSNTLYETYAEQAEFYIFLQYLCFEQMSRVKKYADSCQFLLKGDLPILVDRDSADVWRHPEYFDLDYSAGAPPDFYNAEGQDWGFPVYQWENLAKDDYFFWKERLRVAENFYHLYRLDHVVGFYRIWAKPLNSDHSRPHFIPEDPSLWIPHGEAIMKALLRHSKMLPIGEDLGTVPDVVRESQKNLGICGTKVIRWEREKINEHNFLNYSDYHPLSLTCVSTHDSETLASWWQTHNQDAEAFCRFKHWEVSRTLTFDRHLEILRDSHATPSLFHINLIQEYLALFTELVWESPEKERINIPGVEDPQNWTYRIKPTLEELFNHQGLHEAMERIMNF